jgi:hypothetical protein
VFEISLPNLKRPVYGCFSPFFSTLAPAMHLKKVKTIQK